MPPRFQPVQAANQKPLYNEIIALQKLLGTDILEQAARILDHFTAIKQNKLEATSFQTPPQLNDKLKEKCEEFEIVCDQIYYILEHSKHVLQLDHQQKIIQAKELKKEQQQHALDKMETENDPMQMDQDMDFNAAQLDMSMDETVENMPSEQDKQKAMAIDEEDMEELLQIQRDRLDWLKNVVVLGMDADAAKSNGREEKTQDLLF
ncbi:hypothetical protein EDC96DRAFT_532365 [Choanephora cucurbitarum]|nr:hypothetical protein EDC96DRAFT_532365 [Choanephora cucurbitarum]